MTMLTLWNDRSPRERIMLGALGCVTASILVWLLVLRPIAEARSSAAATRDQAVQALGETRFYAREIAKLSGAAAQARPKSAQTLAATATAAGLTVSGAEETDGTFRLRFDAVPSKSFFGWVAAVEAQGVPVRTMSAVPNAAGSLKAEVAFGAPR
ncbi:type II secretion system protein GspM [Allosphingosinicella deserti]|nr:type II secretion system protein GspM [Sphingomonas deserti]